MARFVMLAIPDNADATAFVNAIKANHIFYGVPAKEDDAFEPEMTYHALDVAAEAVAMWADPTKLCECHPPWKLPNAKEPAAGLQCNAARSVNYGWLVCMQCNKPHPHQYQHPKNLLVPDETPSTRTYVLGFKADRSKKDGTAPGS
jgi:hypothetical protein